QSQRIGRAIRHPRTGSRLRRGCRAALRGNPSGELINDDDRTPLPPDSFRYQGVVMTQTISPGVDVPDVRPSVKILADRCAGCQECVIRCPTGALSMDSKRWV